MGMENGYPTSGVQEPEIPLIGDALIDPIAKEV
jgi:hypothetical protein